MVYRHGPFIAIATISLLGLVLVMSSSDAKDQVSKDGLTVSHDASQDPPFEWTLERMLLAQPMPMTAEGRSFLNTHPSLDGIRTWDDAKFDAYLDSDYAKQHMSEEALRWRELAVMLEGQSARGSKVLGKPVATNTKTKCLVDWSKLTVDDLRKMLDGKEKRSVFAQMKVWRQEIAELASKVEAMRKEAETKGISDRFEEAVSTGSD